jgi:pheromone shutdown protein TraB
MKIFGLIVVLILAYFNLKNEIKIGQIVWLLVGSVITLQGFAMLANPHEFISGVGVVVLGLFVMKPPTIFRGKR